MTMQQVKNTNKTDKHIHSHKKRYLEVISRFTRFKEFNREKKIATKTSNMFKIVPRIGTCDAGFSSSKFRLSCLPFVVKQTTLPVSSLLLLSRNYGWLEFFPWSHRIRDNESQLYIYFTILLLKYAMQKQPVNE